MKDPPKPPPPNPAKAAREAELARALRANLRRRKVVVKPAKPKPGSG